MLRQHPLFVLGSTMGRRGAQEKVGGVIVYLRLPWHTLGGARGTHNVEASMGRVAGRKVTRRLQRRILSISGGTKKSAVKRLGSL